MKKLVKAIWELLKGEVWDKVAIALHGRLKMLPLYLKTILTDVAFALIHALSALLTLLLAVVCLLAGILKVLLIVLVKMAKAAWEWISENVKASLIILSVALAIGCIVLYVSGKAAEQSLQHKVDMLELRCDTLRECSLYDIGYRDGMVHRKQLTINN